LVVRNFQGRAEALTANGSILQNELKEIFDYVMKNNNWAEADEVLAIGDYGNIIYHSRET